MTEDDWLYEERRLTEIADDEARLLADLTLDHVDTATDRSLEHTIESYRAAREARRAHQHTTWSVTA